MRAQIAAGKAFEEIARRSVGFDVNPVRVEFAGEFTEADGVDAPKLFERLDAGEPGIMQAMLEFGS